MNCFNHSEQVAVANCVDCGKGLCKECTSLYNLPICSECNLKRAGNDKLRIYKSIGLSIIFFIIGFIWVFTQAFTNDPAPIFFKIAFSAIIGWFFAGIPWGWKAINFITPQMFIAMSLFGWLLYYVIKGILSLFVGIVAFPVMIVRWIIQTVSTNKKQKFTEEQIKQSQN